MKSSTVPGLIILMLFTNSITAQNKQVYSIQWEIPAELPVGKGQSKALGFAGPVSGVCQQVLMVGGGANFPDSMPWQGGRKKYYDDVYVFRKKGKAVTLLNKLYKLPDAIAYSASCATPQGIVYAGGENKNGISNKVILLQWNATAQNIITKNLPDLPIAVTNAAITANNNTIYLAGGEMANGVSAGFYSLDLGNTAGGWKQLPSLPKPVSHAVMAVLSAKGRTCVYLIGGRKKNADGISDLYASLYEFDLAKNQWSAKKSLPYPLCAGTGMAMDSKYLLMFGGDKGETFHKAETLIAAINAEKDEAKKQALIQEKNKLQSSHPGFSKEVLLYDAEADTWRAIGNIPFNTPVTTRASKWGKNVVIPGGEIRAGVRTPQVLLGKISFK